MILKYPFLFKRQYIVIFIFLMHNLSFGAARAPSRAGHARGTASSTQLVDCDQTQ